MEISRIPPCPDYDIRGTEKWLEEMAAKGYILCEGHAFQSGRAYFLTGEPRRIRYRLDAAKDVRQNIYGFHIKHTPPDDATQRFHAEFGWKYITYRGQFWIYACEDAAAPELNTDPQIQAITLKYVTTRLWKQFLYLLLYGFLMCQPNDLTFFSTLVNKGVAAYWPKLVFFALACAACLPGLVHLIRFRNSLTQGILPEGRVRSSDTLARFLYIAKFLPLVWLLLAILLVPRGYIHNGVSLDSPGSADVPFATVTELFPQAEVTYITNSNSLYEWSTDASPENYKLQEQFRLTLPDGSTTTGLWKVGWYETRFDWIALGYAAHLRFQDWIGGTQRIDVTFPDAAWSRVYWVEPASEFGEPYLILILVRDNIAVQATFLLYEEDFPIQYAPEELGQLLLDSMVQ